MPLPGTRMEINPENPVAVAEALLDLLEACQAIISSMTPNLHRMRSTCVADSAIEKIRVAVAKAKEVINK